MRCRGAASLDLVWVAAGRVEIYWENGLSAWDIAAGVLIAQEAGATVSNYQGKAVDIFKGEVLVCNAFLHQASIQLLSSNSR